MWFFFSSTFQNVILFYFLDFELTLDVKDNLQVNIHVQTVRFGILEPDAHPERGPDTPRTQLAWMAAPADPEEICYMKQTRLPSNLDPRQMEVEVFS